MRRRWWQSKNQLSLEGGWPVVAISIAIPVIAVTISVAVVAVAGVVAIPAVAVVVAPVARPVAPFAVAAIHNFEVGAAAAIDPDAVAIITPGAIEHAVGLAALAHDEDPVARIDGAEVALHVVGRAIHQGGGAGLPVASHPEVRAAATIGPDSALSVSPGLAFDTSGLAALANQAHAEAGVGGAPHALHGVGGAIDHVRVAPAAELVVAIRVTIPVAVMVPVVVSIMVAVVIPMLDYRGSLHGNLKLRAAAAIDPDSVPVEAPGAIEDAFGFALLVNHLDATAGVRRAHVAVHVVRVAGHAHGLRHGISLRRAG